jgi:hypothetical protein
MYSYEQALWSFLGLKIFQVVLKRLADALQSHQVRASVDEEHVYRYMSPSLFAVRPKAKSTLST